MEKETIQFLSPIIASVLAGGRRNPLGVGLSRANFGPARQGGRDFVVTPNEAKQREVKLPTVDVAVEMAKQMQEQPMDFDAGIVYIPGSDQNNAGLVRTPENLASFVHQTPEEHQAALNEFVNKPEFADHPDKAIQLGIKNEEGLAKWWNDHNPRRPVTPTSSAVKKARIGANGDIYITFGSGDKEYQYEGSPDPVKASQILQQLVTSPSIGKSVNSWSGDWGKAHTYLPK